MNHTTECESSLTEALTILAENLGTDLATLRAFLNGGDPSERNRDMTALRGRAMSRLRHPSLRGYTGVLCHIHQESCATGTSENQRGDESREKKE